MSNVTKPIPEGFHTLTPHITVRDAKRAIEFYKIAFDAEVREIRYTDERKVMYALLQIGNALLILNDEFPELGAFAPQSQHGGGFAIHVYLDDVDPVFERAVAAGARVKMPLTDAFWGDRYGQLMDPFGHKWSLATRMRNVSREDMRRAQHASFGSIAATA
jgi:PhnB protein